MPNDVFNYSVLGVFTLDEILLFLGYVAFCLVLLALGFGTYSLLLRRANTKVKKRLDFLDELWSQQMLEVLAGDYPLQTLTQNVKESDAVYFLNFLHKYAKLIRGEELAVIYSLAAPYIHILIPQTKSRDIEVRANAIHLLAALGYERYREIFYDALNDHSTYVSIFAMQAIVQNKSLDYFPRVLNTLNRYEFWSISYLSSLISQAGGDACPLLREALIDSNNSNRIRIIIAEALQIINDYPASASAVKVLQTTTTPDLAAACIRLLSKVGTKYHLEVVLDYVHSPHNAVRIAAVNAVAVLGEREKVIPVLIDALTDSSVRVALQAARGLIKCGAKDALTELSYKYHERGTLIQQILNEASI